MKRLILLLAALCAASPSYAQQPSANTVYAGPTSGAAAAARFRALVPADLLSSTSTLYVDHVSGVDQVGCGSVSSGASACATILYAFRSFQTWKKISSGTAIIQSDCGFTESPPAAFLGPSATGGSGGGVVFIKGNEASPASCTWTSAGWIVDDGAVISVRGFKTINASTGQTWVSVSKMGLMVFANMLWGPAVSGAHMQISDGGVLVAEGGGTYQVGAVGDACLPNCFNYHIINNGGTFEFGGQTVTVPAALTFNDWYSGASGARDNWGTNTFSGPGSGTGSTGGQYSVINGSNLQTGSTTLPGEASSNLIRAGSCVNNICVPGYVGNVAGMPACQNAGAIATVTDANGQFWGGQPSGGGSNIVQEYCNGSVWSINGGGETTGSAAYFNTGTSGHTIPFLDGTNLWSGLNTYGTGDLAINGGTATAGLATVTSAGVVSSEAAATAPQGGSGIASPAAHSILQAEGASNFGLLTAATAGNIIIDQGSGADWLSKALSGDCTLAASGAITCTKTNGVFPIVLGGYVHGVDLNSGNTDNSIAITSPTTNYTIDRIVIENTGTTASLTTVTYGVFSAATGGGTAVVAGGTSLSAITATGVNTTTGSTLSSPNGYYNFSTLYFRVGTAQGASATANVYVYIRPAP